VRDIYLQAERCDNHHKDENVWVEVVRSAFRISNVGYPEDMIEINSVYTIIPTSNSTRKLTNSYADADHQSDLLSIPPDSILPLAQKACLTLAFNPYYAKVSSVWRAV